MNIEKENIETMPEENIEKDPEKTAAEEEKLAELKDAENKEGETPATEDTNEEQEKTNLEKVEETEKKEAPTGKDSDEEHEEMVTTEAEEVEDALLIQKQQEEKADEDVGKEEEMEAEAEDEDEEEEEHIAVLEQPLVVEGKRRRTTTARLEVASPQVERPKKIYQGGKGVHLGSIDYVRDKVNKHKAEDLKALHRLLYGTPKASTKVIKKEIRAFSGFDFEEDSDEAKKRSDLIHKLTIKEINDIKQILGLIKKGDAGTGKEALINVIMPFLFAPDDHHRKVAVSKRGKKRAATAKATPAAKRARKSNKNEESDEDDVDDEEENEMDEEKDGGDEEDDEVKKENEEVAAHDSSSDTSTPKKRVSFTDEVVSPTHEQLLSSCTRHIKDGKRDLENFSMKDVIEAVETEFAKADLSERKEEIREIVRSLLVEE